MAIYHCSISNVSRAKGSSSCATLAYITGEKVHDDRIGNTYSYSRQERVLTVGTILPPFAPAEYANAERLFNAIEKHETADNARTAKKIQVALPKELGLEEQKTIIEDYIRHNLTKEGYCVTYAIHDGGRKGNDHAHLLISNRPINDKGQWGCKRKMTYALDKNGERIPLLTEEGQQKTDSHGRKQWKRVNVEQNPLDTRDFLFHLRKEWAVEVNKHLAPEQQIDYRSNAARGIEDTPTIHEGYAARAMEKRGEMSERCEINREIRQENAERRQARQELAAKQAELARLEREEREHDERLGKLLRRRENATAIGGLADGERTTASEDTSVRAVNSDNQTAREQAGRADRLRALLERREREATEIRREREEAARSQQAENERILAHARKIFDDDVMKRALSGRSVNAGQVQSRIAALTQALDVLNSKGGGNGGIVDLGSSMTASAERAMIEEAIGTLKNVLATAEAKADAVRVLDGR